MPLFITYASYSHSGVKGTCQQAAGSIRRGQDVDRKSRRQACSALQHDGRATMSFSFPSSMMDPDAVAVGMAVAATGAISRIETVRAWTPGEFKGVAEKAARFASAYSPPGA